MKKSSVELMHPGYEEKVTLFEGISRLFPRN